MRDYEKLRGWRCKCGASRLDVRVWYRSPESDSIKEMLCTKCDTVYEKDIRGFFKVKGATE